MHEHFMKVGGVGNVDPSHRGPSHDSCAITMMSPETVSNYYHARRSSYLPIPYASLSSHGYTRWPQKKEKEMYYVRS